ncbi:hypothetical protein GCM10027294_51040 [Marinactinospora endophytica]
MRAVVGDAGQTYGHLMSRLDSRDWIVNWIHSGFAVPVENNSRVTSGVLSEWPETASFEFRPLVVREVRDRADGRTPGPGPGLSCGKG